MAILPGRSVSQQGPYYCGRSTTASDASSDSDDDYIRVAIFDVLWRDDLPDRINYDGIIEFKLLIDKDFDPYRNHTQSDPSEDYLAVFRLGKSECVYKCSAQANGMGWENFREWKRNRSFKKSFLDSQQVYFCFSPTRILDDNGVPMLRFIWGNPESCTEQVVGFWRKMRDATYADEAEFSEAELERIKAREQS